jgi:hypothetical protein
MSLKEQWLEGLRSGEYKQGKYALQDEHGGYCCLGVLVKVHGQNHPDRAYKDTKVSEDLRRTLVQMNDHENKSFEQIANYIEVNL